MNDAAAARRLRAWRRLLALALVVAASISACTVQPTATDDPSPDTAEPSDAPTNPQAACVEGAPVIRRTEIFFDSTCFGWRIGPHEALEAAGLQDRDLQLDCELVLYGSSLDEQGLPVEAQPTDIDITFIALPGDAQVNHIMKWACGRTGASDLLTVTLDGVVITVERALQATASVEVDAARGSVAACAVLGTPAICIDAPSDIAQVIVLEDATTNPHATVLRIYSEEAPLATLLELASRVVRR